MKSVSVLSAATLLAVVLTSVAGAATKPAAPTTPAASSGPPTITELATDDRIHGVTVSPSGRYLAIVRHTDGRDFIQIIDLTTRTQSTLALGITALQFAVLDVHWKSDDQLVYAYERWLFTNDGRGASRRPVLRRERAYRAVGRDGTRPRDIEAVDVVDWLDAEPGKIVIQTYPKSSVMRWSQAVKLDLVSGETTVLEEGNASTRGYAADRAGNIVVRYERMAFGQGLRVMGRSGDAGWSELFTLREKDVRSLPELEVMGAAPDPAKLYVATKPAEGEAGDTRQLRLFDLATRTLGPPLASVPRYDFNAVRFDKETGEVTGLCYWADVYRCDMTDPEARKDYEAFVARFGPDRSVFVHATSERGEIQIVFVRGPTDPGSYHVYDRRTGKFETLGNQRPSLKGDRLSPTTRVTWKARDGFELSGFLTTPRQAPAGKPPLILMPHGGPEARDNFDYDRWAQAFAARGYAVFQPNFRGSGGFGSRFAAMGYRQWGLRMQDDVMDGLQALIDEGKVDPDRVCAVGASYGGYVSLYAGAKAPERFKCIVSFAGVSDLVSIQKWERSRNGEDSATYRYWLKSIGDPDKDRDQLAATSPITYAKTYGPPVLLIHGELDDIVPISQSRDMEAALRRAGRSVKLIEVDAEWHSGWTSENEIQALTDMIEFVDAAIGKPRP